MDVREKLTHILTSDPEMLKNLNASTIRLYRLVDKLINNGVTVQEWISTSERLPSIPDGWAENPDCVLYMMKNTKTIYAGYYGEGGIWRDKYFRQYADSRNGVDAEDVLCWMYQKDLPQPPKGE